MRVVLLGPVAILLTEHGPDPLRLAVLATAVALSGAWLARAAGRALVRHRRARRHRAATAKARTVVDAHLDTLVRRRLALERVDRYGVTDRTAWVKEMRHFADRVLLPGLARSEREEVARRGTEAFLARVLEAPVDSRARERRRTLVAAEAADPAEFEVACADLLGRLGWRAEVTPASGDQGADIVAWKGGVCAVVQCKMWRGAVGNAAVQEVLAAKLFYGADVAAVVTTSRYTASAVKLAERCGVVLLGAGEVGEFDRFVRGCGVVLSVR